MLAKAHDRTESDARDSARRGTWSRIGDGTYTGDYTHLTLFKPVYHACTYCFLSVCVYWFSARALQPPSARASQHSWARALLHSCARAHHQARAGASVRLQLRLSVSGLPILLRLHFQWVRLKTVGSTCCLRFSLTTRNGIKDADSKTGAQIINVAMLRNAIAWIYVCRLCFTFRTHPATIRINAYVISVKNICFVDWSKINWPHIINILTSKYLQMS